MSWYTACLVFEVKNHNLAEASFFEESWILFSASDTPDAERKVKQTGLGREESFLNNHSDLVSWTFIGSRHIKQIELEQEMIELVSMNKEHPGYTENSTRDNHAAATTG